MLLALCACTSQLAKHTTSEQTTADASSNSDAAANADDSTETAVPSGETVTILQLIRAAHSGRRAA